MGNLLSSTPRRGTRSSSPLATNDAVPSNSLQGTTPSPPPQGPRDADVGEEAVLRKVLLATNDAVPSTSQQGTTPSPPPPQGPRDADVGEEAVLRRVIQGLRKHVPELYRQLRDGPQFDPDVVEIIIDIADKASGGTPWPVRLALQSVLFLAHNALQAHDNAILGDSLALTVEELRRKLQRLEGVRVPDEHQDELKNISASLAGASAVVDDIVRSSSSPRTCTTCLHAFFCAQCTSKEISDVRADLEKCLGSIRDILTAIIADRMERPSDKAPEVPFHLVGMGGPVSKVMRFLRDSGENTRVVGLHGQGGIGKSTLMRVVEANLRSDSQGDGGSRITHKIASVEVGMQPAALKDLQKSLYSQLSDGSNESFSSEAQGRVALKELMEKLKGRGKTICLFLDNVWEPEHLMELLPQPHDLADALPRGSYLLISSRSANVVDKLASMCFKSRQEKAEGYLDCQLDKLPKEDAEDLFLRNAYMEKEENPLQRDDPLVQAIVPGCDGLPLALTVYGSYFKDGNRRKPDVWKSVLEQLKRAEDPRFADQRVFQKLKASVDFQDKSLQDAFLDVALLPRPFASIRDWDGRDWDGVSVVQGEALELVVEKDDLDYLVDQSLVIRRKGRLEVHDLLFTVAKQMAKERNVWYVTKNTSEDEIAELLLPHPQVPSIRCFDEHRWLRCGQKSYPSSAQIRDVRYLLLNGRENVPELVGKQRREEFGVMITQHCYKLQLLVVDTLVQEQLSWITNLRQLRWLSVSGEGDSFAGISKVRS